MKPILFDASESVFSSNGLGRLSDCISCFVEEVRNGKYELEMEYPVSGDHFAEILHSRFIFAVPADGKEPQPFRIYAITKPIGGVCTIYAEHISYQLFHIPLNPFLPEAIITRAFQAIKANAAEDCPFEFSTDKTTVANFKVDEPKSIREVLYGSEGSILDVYGGGEYEWDKYNVILHQHRGTDRGVVLRYGKDITDLTQEENIEDTITGIYPFWKGQNDEQEDVLVTLPEKVVHSANAGNFPYKRTVTLDCSSEFETAPTVTQLRTYATNYISQNNIGVPDVSITVSFAPLWQTEEYKDIANLERVNLCDTVTVHYEKLGVDATAKVIRTKYDVLNERYEEIELGSAKSSVASVIRGDIQSAIETAAKRSTEIENKLHVEITENTRKITGGLGGHVVLKLNADGEPEEILIMDTDDVTTAVNVWRFNMGGLGHSHSGYNGPFDDIALTMDGHINANMITVGTLNANLIKAGVLSDSQGINFIDMETGEMRIGASASLGGSTIAQHKANAVSTANGYTDAQLADYKDTVDAVVSNLQSQIDGQVMTWYYDYEPTMNNKPASDWTTTALRQQHEGDVFYWKSKGYAYRFMQSGSTWGWTLVQDTDITSAIAKAENAQDTADHKRRVFVTQPVPPYDIGDLWTQGSSGDLYRCETARASGSYVASDWKKATKYTDDTAVDNLEIGGRNLLLKTNQASNVRIVSAHNSEFFGHTGDFNFSDFAKDRAVSGDLITISFRYTISGNSSETARIYPAIKSETGSSFYIVTDSTKQIGAENPQDAVYSFSGNFRSSNIVPSKFRIYVYGTQNATCVISNIMFEFGNKRTSWTLAPEDVEADIAEINSWITGDYASTIQTIQGQIDGKAETYHQSADPSDDWTSAEYANHTGDLWYDTSDGTTYYWNGAVWVSQDVPDAVFDAIDGKAQIFVNTPTTPYAVGDLWFNSATSDIMTCINARASGSYTASDWQKRNKYTDDTAVTTLNNTLNQTEIFNRLTNSGAIQGIYMQNGQLYLNATYMQTGTMSANRILGGTLKLGGSNNTNGLLEVYDASGTKIGYLDRTGVNVLKGSISGANISLGGSSDTSRFKMYNASDQEFVGISRNRARFHVGDDYLFIGLFPRDSEEDTTGTLHSLAISNGAYQSASTAYCAVGPRSFDLYENSGGSGKAIFVADNGGIYSSERLIIGPSRGNPTTAALDVVTSPNEGYINGTWEYNGVEIATRSSSSRRYKHSIQPIESEALDPHKLLDLPVVQFEWNDDHPLQYDDMKGQTIPGIIAEDVEEIYPAATIHDAEGRVESWDERRLIPGMLALIQEQDKKIKELEARLAKIEEMLK